MDKEKAEIDRLSGMISQVRKACYGYIDKNDNLELYVFCPECGAKVQITTSKPSKGIGK